MVTFQDVEERERYMIATLSLKGSYINMCIAVDIHIIHSFTDIIIYLYIYEYILFPQLFFVGTLIAVLDLKEGL